MNYSSWEAMDFCPSWYRTFMSAYSFKSGLFSRKKQVFVFFADCRAGYGNKDADVSYLQRTRIWLFKAG
jgi:hypothetical protein